MGVFCFFLELFLELLCLDLLSWLLAYVTRACFLLSWASFLVLVFLSCASFLLFFQGTIQAVRGRNLAGELIP